MIIVMQRQADEAAVARVVDFIRSRGLSEHVSRGDERTIIGAVGDERVFDPQELQALPQVERAIRILADWRIISRESRPDNTVLTVRGHRIGAGGCLTIPQAGWDGGLPEAGILYTDPFFVHPSPYYAAQQAGEKQRQQQMSALLSAAHAAGKAVVVRIRDVRQIQAALAAQADILYLGGELMTNRVLQQEVGLLNVPLILCKDKHHRAEEWLTAAEHIALKGNHHILLGESGTLSFDPQAPHRLDTEAICKAKKISHLPVIANIIRLPHRYMDADVLHALAEAAGADGVIA